MVPPPIAPSRYAEKMAVAFVCFGAFAIDQIAANCVICLNSKSNDFIFLQPAVIWARYVHPLRSGFIYLCYILIFEDTRRMKWRKPVDGIKCKYKRLYLVPWRVEHMCEWLFVYVYCVGCNVLSRWTNMAVSLDGVFRLETHLFPIEQMLHVPRGHVRLRCTIFLALFSVPVVCANL